VFATALDTGLSGKAAPFTAISAWPVTQTGVWSLVAEYR
jgi:hypothetical protein